MNPLVCTLIGMLISLTILFVFSIITGGLLTGLGAMVVLYTGIIFGDALYGAFEDLNDNMED